MNYSEDYFDVQYPVRGWRRRGEKPILHRTWVRRLTRLSRRDGWFLEVGCGEGDFLRRASRAFQKAVGLDVSAHGLQQARLRGCRAVVRGSALNLPFRAHSVATLVALDVVEHLPTPEQFFSEAARIVTKGGLLAISTPNPSSFGARRKGSAWFACRDASHMSVLPMGDWRRLLSSNGFEIVDDGTDFLWDVPYFRRVPRVLEWLFFITLQHLLQAWDVVYPWECGENYICIARRL
jgi:SAM-dependent methyltransferase